MSVAQAEVRELETAAGSKASICRNGAHLLSWTPAGEAEDRLFLSTASSLQTGASIRGGVPVIFPQFGTLGPLAKHGFARTREWQWKACALDRARLYLHDDAGTRAIWPHAFELFMDVTLTDAELRMSLTVRNTGPVEISLTLALHSYLRVADIGHVSLHGLEGCRYRDATRDLAEAIEDAPSLRFGAELDRIYLDTPAELRLEEGPRQCVIQQAGFTDTVVWNPGAEKAAAMPDMEVGGERRMLCVEAAVANRPLRIAAGGCWEGMQALRIA